jgi:RNA polymerase sigma factor (sigma-70 family)
MANDTADGASPAKPRFKSPPGCPDFAEAVKLSTPDRSLFGQIVDCFADRLVVFARHHCRDETLGMDAFQEAMIAALNNLESYRGDSPIEPWLRRIVVSACSRLRRGKKNDPSINVPLEEERTGAPEEATDQELQLMMVQALSQVREQIEALDEPNRTLLMEHDVREVPIADLTERFDLSAEAVKSRLKRARAEVRRQILERV